MIVRLLTDHHWHLEFLSLKGGCTGSSESTLVKMPHCWKSHAMAQFLSFQKWPRIIRSIEIQASQKKIQRVMRLQADISKRFGRKNKTDHFVCHGHWKFIASSTIENLCTPTAQSLPSGCSRQVHRIVDLAVKKGNILVNILLLKIFFANDCHL